MAKTQYMLIGAFLCAFVSAAASLLALFLSWKAYELAELTATEVSENRVALYGNGYGGIDRVGKLITMVGEAVNAAKTAEINAHNADVSACEGRQDLANLMRSTLPAKHWPGIIHCGTRNPVVLQPRQQ